MSTSEKSERRNWFWSEMYKKLGCSYAVIANIPPFLARKKGGENEREGETDR